MIGKGHRENHDVAREEASLRTDDEANCIQHEINTLRRGVYHQQSQEKYQYHWTDLSKKGKYTSDLGFG